ncbi:AbrB/MazE/SpoVT family DNA-binding domain-containing protein [Thermaerobacter subterraneus]|uniref:AbrB/MazE/SpoVT family DNA-binding domain-containing protein n=1 Tax=Thermaerobacter subterraneus TaxID=175696 RepID=UPI0031019AFA
MISWTAIWPPGRRPSLTGSPPTTATSGAWRRGWRNGEGEGDRAVAIAILQRGQVTLAKAIRERVDLAEGDEVLVDVNGNGEIVLTPLAAAGPHARKSGSSPPSRGRAGP